MTHHPVKRSPGDPYSGWYPELTDGMDCERLREYEHGQLCPIIHDDILSGTDLFPPQPQEQVAYSFKIIGKLGYGAFSTVWLGRELTSNRHLALKVLRREDSTLDNSEMRILKKLGKLQVAFFHTHQPNGFRYLCLGTEPLGSTLSYRLDAEVPFPSSLKSVTSFLSVMMGRIVDLHERGICHGDISSGNVALGLHKDAFTPEALKEAFQYEVRSHTELTLRSLLVVSPSKISSTPLCPRKILLDIIGKASTNPEGQLKIIDMALRENGYLYQHPHQRWTVAQIIHCLVQMDPAARDVGKAMAMLDELEREGDELNVDNGEEAEA